MTDRNARPLQTTPMFQPRPDQVGAPRFVGVDLGSRPDVGALVVGGRQAGKNLEVEAAMRTAIAAGHQVLEKVDGRFVGVRLGEAGQLLRDS